MDQLEEFDIRQYLDALKRRWWVIATAMMLCATVALAYSLLSPKIYEATAKVLISAQQDTSGTGNALTDPNQLQNQMQTQVQIATSDAVKAEADRLLGGDSERVLSIDASGVTNTRVMEITAQSKSPQIAQHAADVYSQTYLQAGTRTAIDRVAAIGESVNQKKAQLQSQIDQLNAQSVTNIPPSVLAERDERKAQLKTQIDQIQRQYDNAQAEALVREAAAAPFASAERPEDPVSPQPVRNLALALVLGTLLGAAIALAWERVDDRLRSGERFSRWFPQVPVLGSIPRVENWKNRDEARNITLVEPRSVTAEAYRGLRTSLDFMALDQDLDVIEVTSSTAGEGKSTTVSNLATAMAWAGRDVIVVSADLRRPRVHQFFGVTNERGLTDALLNPDQDPSAFLETVSLDSQTSGSIRVLGTGSLPPNPSEILGSQSVKNLVEKLRTLADIVILDAPPILPVSDPIVLSQFADGVVLVANANSVTRNELQRAFQATERSLRCPILGVVINDSEEAAAYSSKYDYQPTQTSNTAIPTEPIHNEHHTAHNNPTTPPVATESVKTEASTQQDNEPAANIAVTDVTTSGASSEPGETTQTRKGLLGRKITKAGGTTKSEPTQAT